MNNQKVYRSKIGLEIWIPVFIAIWAIAIPIVISKTYAGLLIPFGFTLFLTMIIRTTKYTIDGERLRVQCWLVIDESIRIQDIYSIRKTLNPISSPAAAIIALQT